MEKLSNLRRITVCSVELKDAMRKQYQAFQEEKRVMKEECSEYS